MLRVLTAGLFLAALYADAPAQETGQVAGAVLDDATGEPLPYANVVVVGTGRGAMSQTDGSFFITGVPVGDRKVLASYIGFHSDTAQVAVTADRTTEVDFRLRSTVAREVETVEVRALRPLVEIEKTSTVRSFNADELKNLTINPTLDSVVEQQPGIIRDRGELHVRGGRADETILIVDGVKMKDVLSGTSESSTISARSVAEVDIITGGFDAKYGEALSGVIETRLKDGTPDWHGSLHYETDHLFNDWDTDVVQAQVSGPNVLLEGLGNLFGMEGDPPTFYLDLSTELTDTHLPSIGDLEGRYLDSSYEETVPGGSFTYGRFFYPRANNAWRGLFKTAWKVGRKDKLSLSLTKALAFDEGFGDVDIADIDRNSFTYPWAWKNRLDHYYTFSRDQNSASLTWQHTYGLETIQTLRATRFFTATHRDVAGQHWTEYDIDRDRNYNWWDEPREQEYWIDFGDATDYRNRYVETWGLNGDWAWTPGRHKVEWGFNTQYEDVQFFTLDAFTINCSDPSSAETCPKPLGDEYDLFHVYPTTGAFYIQDAMEYEGFIARAGLRYDYWFPGEQVERLVERADRPTITPGLRREFRQDTQEIFGRRFKGHLSPRIGVSYPITQQDHIFFHYGHFSQRPAYFYVYAKSGTISGEAFPRIGNPNLNPEVSVQYELGVGHQFSSEMAFKLTLFNKDIYDYPTSTTIELADSPTGRSSFFIYRNLDYARTRGVELELKKKRSNYWSGALSYTYSVSKGKSSDPNALRLVQESGGDARETELEEIFLWWNRPHKFTAYANFRVYEDETPPQWLGFNDVGLNVYYRIRSGRAYTPHAVDPATGQTFQSGQRYSRNGPMDSGLNFTFTKGFRFWGRRWELFFQGWNVFNHRTPITFDWVTGEPYKLGEGSLIRPEHRPEYLQLGDEELIEAFGLTIDENDDPTLVAEGLRRQIRENIRRYGNPAYYDEPRHFRLGLTVEW
ncbi:MAG: TonB-dependent receptor [Candidatus Eisenbacteria bacterium]|nr:TonB-dependent receptor [Candidatus Eisenbacteria bacterium]